jgi:hypothetical protein
MKTQPTLVLEIKIIACIGSSSAPDGRALHIQDKQAA